MFSENSSVLRPRQLGILLAHEFTQPSNQEKLPSPDALRPGRLLKKYKALSKIGLDLHHPIHRCEEVSPDESEQTIKAEVQATTLKNPQVLGRRLSKPAAAITSSNTMCWEAGDLPKLRW